MRTPPLSERILAGITRESILSLLRGWGEIVEERPITVDEVVYAAENGYLEEAFGMGTAAVVSPISTIGFRERDFDVPNNSDGVGMKLKKALNDIRTGKVADEYNWMLKI